MNKSEKASIRILRVLLKSGKISAFLLFKKIKTEFPVFLEAILNLKKEKMINEVDNIIFISRKGREMIHSSRFRMILSDDKAWKEIPKEFLDNKIDLWGFYIPSIKKLDRNYFVNLLKEDKSL